MFRLEIPFASMCELYGGKKSILSTNMFKETA